MTRKRCTDQISPHVTTRTTSFVAIQPTNKISRQYFKLMVTQRNSSTTELEHHNYHDNQQITTINTKNQEQIASVRIDLPYVKGTSEQLKRIFNDHNINSTFYTTTTLHALLLHVKDPVPSEQRNKIVYKYDCKDCEAVYFAESKRTIAERTKEHTRAVIAADTRRYKTADHFWKYKHDFDWENKKIMDYETNTTTRRIKETIHLLSNNNHINGISYRLPHIWFPALKLKGISDVNTLSNQNEETNNQSHASSVSTQVRH